MSEEIADLWVEIGTFRSLPDAEQHALVLVATGIRSQLVSGEARTALLVATADAARARTELDAYAEENRQPVSRAPALRPLREGVDAVLVYGIVLVLMHAAATQGAFSVDWVSIGSTQSGLIKGGEWWRAVTALSLHADIEHLMSNLTLGAVLGLLLAQIVGGGLAWFAILLSGAAGNIIVALAGPDSHAAIGASTAVFGALGLLAASAWGRQGQLWRGLRRWRPVAAAVMLLALLGIGGERTDVWAHVAGLGAGLAGGAGLYLGRDHLPTGRPAQLALGAAALALFTISWLVALTRG